MNAPRHLTPVPDQRELDVVLVEAAKLLAALDVARAMWRRGFLLGAATATALGCVALGLLMLTGILR